jgi:hypothetical protein
MAKIIRELLVLIHLLEKMSTLCKKCLIKSWCIDKQGNVHDHLETQGYAQSGNNSIANALMKSSDKSQ